MAVEVDVLVRALADFNVVAHSEFKLKPEQEVAVIGTLSIDNEMHDDDVRYPRRIGSRVSFLVGKQCVVLRRRPLLVLRLIALAMAFKNVRNLLLINPELTTTMALSMTMNLFFCTTSLYRKLRLSVRFVRAF